jgi:drug/metabolite transporter (DMT)-like permease
MTYAAMPPADEGDYGRPASRGAAPSSVLTAVKLMYARAVLGVLGVLLAFTQRGAIEDIVREQNSDFTQSEIDNAVTAALVVTVIIGLVFLVLYVVLAQQVAKGRNWARIVTWVIAGLSLLSFLSTVASDSTGLSKALGLVGAILDIGIVVLLLQKPSNDYFRARPVLR